MSLGATLRRFLELRPGQQLTLVRLWFALGRARLALRRQPFRQLVADLELHGELPEPFGPGPGQERQALELGHWLAVAARFTPWCSSCLVQVLALQRQLAARGIPGQFYLGVRRGEAQAGAGRGPLQAHAWLQCGGVIVNGQVSPLEYTVLSTYRWGGGGARGPV